MLNVPEDKPLPGKIEKLPMVNIGDEAFSLKSYLIKPFPRYNQEMIEKKILTIIDYAEHDE